jgi:DNA-binding ferritin-like protein (Dps family)
MKYTVISSKMEKFGPYTFTEVQNWLAKHRFSIANSKDFMYWKTDYISRWPKNVAVAYEHDFRIENSYGDVLPESYFRKVKKIKPYVWNTGRKRKSYRACARHSKVHKLIKDTFVDAEYSYMVPAKSIAKAYYVAGSWDAPFRDTQRSWKTHRKTQYKVIP